MANPSGEQVIQGAANFARNGNQLTINQGSDRAVINWGNFSIGQNEITKFIQPGASSAVLNRVIGGNGSEIMGHLQSNGQVFLINPNGILFGENAVVNTGAFLASTLNVTNEEFMTGGDMIFEGDSNANITNLGSISADGGDVFLIAQSVSNQGYIGAKDGTVGIATANEVLLKASGDERIFIKVKTKKKIVTEEEPAEETTTETTDTSSDSETTSTDDSTTTSTEETETASSSDTSSTSTEAVAEYETTEEWVPASQYAGSLGTETTSSDSESTTTSESSDSESNTTEQRADTLTTTETTAALAQLHNTGVIEAVKVEMKASGGNMYALAINNEGIVRANGIDFSGGRITLKANTGIVQVNGTLDASSTMPSTPALDAASIYGGNIQVLGE